MSARIVPFEPWHIAGLDGREQEQHAIAVLGGLRVVAAACWDAAYAYSVLAPVDVPVACIGVSDAGGKGLAWAFLGVSACRYWPTIHRGVRTFLRGVAVDSEYRQIDALVAEDHPAAHRWALRLGFLPCAREKWGGKMHVRYAWAR